MLRASAALGELVDGAGDLGASCVGGEGSGGRATLDAVEVGGAPSVFADVPRGEGPEESFCTRSMRLLGLVSVWPLVPATAKNANRDAASASPIRAGAGTFAFALSLSSICSFTRRIADGTAGGASSRGDWAGAATSAAGGTKRCSAEVGGVNGTSSTTGRDDVAPGRVPFSSACMSGVVARK